MTDTGRLAFRVEGANWNAYYSETGSVVDFVFLGSIRMALVQRPDRKQAFIDLMSEVTADLIEKFTGERVEWSAPTQTPESECSGNT